MLGFDGSAFESFLELFEAAGGPGKNMARKIFNPLDAEPSVKDVELVKNHGFGLNCGEIPKCHQRTLGEFDFTSCAVCKRNLGYFARGIGCFGTPGSETCAKTMRPCFHSSALH